MNKPNRIIAGLLAIILGGLGVHQFYMGRVLRGLVYIAFCWTFIPAALGLIDGIVILVKSDEAFGDSLSKKTAKPERPILDMNLVVLILVAVPVILLLKFA